MARTLKLLIVATLALGGCVSDVHEPTASDSHWSYVTGPHGENCLVYTEGYQYSNSRVVAMSCDSVKPER